MLDSLNWFSVEKRLYYFTVISVFKIVNHMAPEYFQKYITFNRDIHTYNIRGTNNNKSLDEDIRVSGSVHIFKHKLKRLLLEKNCYIIDEFF